MKENYDSMSLLALKDLARSRKLKHFSTMKKSELIQALKEQDAQEPAPVRITENTSPEASASAGSGETVKAAEAPGNSRKRKLSGETRETGKSENAEIPVNTENKENTVRSENTERTENAMRTEHADSGTAQPEKEKDNFRGTQRSYSQDGAGEKQPGEKRSGKIIINHSRPVRSPRISDRPGERGFDRTQSRGADRYHSRMPERSSDRFSERSTERASGTLERSSDRNMPRDGAGEYPRETGRENGRENQRDIPRENGREYQRDVSRENTREYVRDASAQEQPREYQRDASRESTRDRDSQRENAREIPRETRDDRPPMDLAALDSGNAVTGILEVMADGYGFIRSDNYLSGDNDVYVAPSQIRKFGLKTGDVISGNTRIRAQQEKFSALLYIRSINGFPPSEAARRMNFEDMTPIFPNTRMKMEREPRDMAMRVLDLFCPIGKGQRGMIVSPPKAGKTTLLKDIAKSILRNEPDMHLLILLIDERPEEVTDIKEAIVGDRVEVIYSTFDELPEHHKRVSEMGIERAKRLVEHGEDVTILLDSITRLARAYNLTVPPSGRTLSGGLDPAALHMPKRFFGAARCMREGGSLTILATALVDTGSKMDDVVYEEFKGTGNMELVLDRKLSERRIFPAIDIQKSGTRREDLLLTPEEQEACYIMRRGLNSAKSEETVENILNMIYHTRSNEDFVNRVRRQRFV